MAKRRWNRVVYSHMQLKGRKLPKDGSWSVWKDKFGNIEIARFKMDAQDHFFPSPIKIKDEENIIAWRELRKNRRY